MKAQGDNKSDMKNNNSVEKNKDFLRCTIKYDGMLLLINIKRNRKKKNTIMWTLHAFSGIISKYVFSSMKSINSAANDKHIDKEISHKHLKHIDYAIKWAYKELPKLMHDASIFLAFHALKH